MVSASADSIASASAGARHWVGWADENAAPIAQRDQPQVLLRVARCQIRVGLDGALGDEQAGGNCPVGEPLGDQR